MLVNEAVGSFAALCERHATSCLALKIVIGRKSSSKEWSHIDVSPKRIEFQHYCSFEKKGKLVIENCCKYINQGGTKKSEFYAKMWRKKQMIVFVRWPRSVEGHVYPKRFANVIKHKRKSIFLFVKYNKMRHFRCTNTQNPLWCDVCYPV